MPIFTPSLSPEQQAVISRTLLGTRSFLPASLANRGAVPRTLTLPHRVFTVRLDALAEGRPLAEIAEPVGWRVLVEEDEKVVASAELRDRSALGTSIPQTAVITRGPLVQGTVAAVLVAEQEESVREQDLELRFVHVPGLHIAVLWLSPRSGSGLIVPISPLPATLDAGRVYDIDEFSQRLTELARNAVERLSDAERPELLGG
ncbi:MAG: hypothetical protein JO372_11470 [Solirubrobacterales bacterium]|nr:hypothetical protein [Solirubrobacterales bacterium]